jgi:hypothetical protein
MKSKTSVVVIMFFREFTHHIIPSGDNRLHVQVRREESNQPIRNGLAHVDQDTSEIPHDSRVISDLEP